MVGVRQCENRPSELKLLPGAARLPVIILFQVTKSWPSGKQRCIHIYRTKLLAAAPTVTRSDRAGAAAAKRYGSVPARGSQATQASK